MTDRDVAVARAAILFLLQALWEADTERGKPTLTRTVQLLEGWLEIDVADDEVA